MDMYDVIMQALLAAERSQQKAERNSRFCRGMLVRLDPTSEGMYEFFLRQNDNLPRKAQQEIRDIYAAEPLCVESIEELEDDGKIIRCCSVSSLHEGYLYIIPEQFLMMY